MVLVFQVGSEFYQDLALRLTLPGDRFRLSGHTFSGARSTGFYSTTTKDMTSSNLIRALYFSNNTLRIPWVFSRAAGLPVRCVKQ